MTKTILLKASKIFVFVPHISSKGHSSQVREKLICVLCWNTVLYLIDVGLSVESSERLLLLVDTSGDHIHSKDHSVTITVFFQKWNQQNFDLYMAPSVKGNLRYILGNDNTISWKELNVVVAETPVIMINILLYILINEQC